MHHALASHIHVFILQTIILQIAYICFLKTVILHTVTASFANVRLNLFNHVLALFYAKFACNLAIRYLVFRWELCKGNV